MSDRHIDWSVSLAASSRRFRKSSWKNVVGRCLTNLCRFTAEEFLVLHVPKKLIIPSWKLGLLLRMMQAAMVIGVLTYGLYKEVWLEEFTPEHWKVDLWSETSPVNKLSNARHCQNSSLYVHKRAGIVQVPTHCSATGLSTGIAIPHVRPGSVFVPTLVDEIDNWSGIGSACSESTRTWCGNGHRSGIYTEANGTGDEVSCACHMKTTFFAMNPEEQVVALRHGFQVDLSRGRNQEVVRESVSMGQDTTAGILTIIKDHNGVECVVGGKSSWSSLEAARAGIRGKLSEWLACAGVPSLEMSPAKLTAGTGLPPHLRSMGLKLNMHRDYLNRHDANHPGTVCFLRVSATVEWTVGPTSQIGLQLPFAVAGSMHVESTHLSVGVEVQAREIGGYYAVFSYRHTVRAIVDCLVLWQVPFYIVKFLGLICLGQLSELYRRAARTRFDFFGHVPRAISKMMLANTGFRGLLGGLWTGRANKLPAMSRRGLSDHLFDLFDDSVQSGLLSQQEVQQMATVTFQHLDSKAKGGITCGDFIRSCTADDVMTLQQLTKFLSKHERTALEGMLDDSRIRLNDQLKVESETRVSEHDEPITVLRRSMRMQQESMATVLQRLEALENNSLNNRLVSSEMQAVIGNSSMQMTLTSSTGIDGDNEENKAFIHQFSSTAEGLDDNVRRMRRQPLWVNDVIDDLERRQEEINQHLRNRLSELEQNVKLMEQAQNTQHGQQKNSSSCSDEVSGSIELQGCMSRPLPMACLEASGREEADDSTPSKQKRNEHGGNGSADAASATVIADNTWDQKESMLLTYKQDATLEYVQRSRI